MDPDTAARKVLERKKMYLARLNGHLGRQIGSRLDAEDILMSALRSFACREHIPDDEGRFWALMNKILSRKWAKAMKHHFAQARTPLKETHPGDDWSPQSDQASPDKERELAELLSDLRNAMDQLPKRSQEIVLLIIEGLPRKEVGAQMQLGERQIHRLYNAAIERLGELMSEPKEPPHDE